MPDKNIDRLFHAKLHDLELQPSDEVWAGIADTLPQGRRKKPMAWLSIAASIALLVAVGYMFLPGKTVKKQLHAVNKPKQQFQVARVQQTMSVSVLKNGITKMASVQKVQHRTVHRVENALNNNHAEKPVAQPVDAHDTLDTRPVLMAKTSYQQINQTDLPVIVPKIKVTDSLSAQQIVKEPVIADNTSKPDTAKKHRIRGLGDLINVVVASVDKRKDKIVEFTDTDEGNALTGINLGFIRIKKER
jgi:hypothetical protein